MHCHKSSLKHIIQAGLMELPRWITKILERMVEEGTAADAEIAAGPEIV